MMTRVRAKSGLNCFPFGVTTKKSRGKNSQSLTYMELRGIEPLTS